MRHQPCCDVCPITTTRLPAQATFIVINSITGLSRRALRVLDLDKNILILDVRKKLR